MSAKNNAPLLLNAVTAAAGRLAVGSNCISPTAYGTKLINASSPPPRKSAIKNWRRPPFHASANKIRESGAMANVCGWHWPARLSINGCSQRATRAPSTQPIKPVNKYSATNTAPSCALLISRLDATMYGCTASSNAPARAPGRLKYFAPTAYSTAIAATFNSAVNARAARGSSVSAYGMAYR